MANGKGKTFKFGKMMFNLSARGIATKDTETGEIRRYPFPWKQSPSQPQESQYNPDEPYDEDQYDQDQYDPNQDYADYQEPEYEEDGSEYYAPEEDEYEEQPASILDADWLMWAALVVLPPLGIWLLWRNNRFDMIVRSAISAASVVWFVILLIWLFSGMKQNQDAQMTPTLSPTLAPSATVDPTTAPTPEKTAVPQPSPTIVPTATAQAGNQPTTNATALPEYVWSKVGGENYHIKQDCRNMEGATRIPLPAAINRGQTPCPECMAPEPTAAPTSTALPAGSYYARPDSKNYHSDPNCQGMKGALVVTQAEAIANGQPACPVCIGSVYMREDGTNYHATSNCRGMKNAKLVTIDYAVSQGKTPCETCLGGSGTGTGTTTGTNTDVYWYNPNGGTNYHKTADCRGMKNAIQASAAAAENSGLTPCPECLGGTSGSANFYATANGDNYHTDPNCRGMKNATRISEATAISRGKTACPTCAGGTTTGGTKVDVNTGNTGSNNNTVNTSKTTYYSTADGENFHTSATCRGMKNATVVTAAQIAERGQTPCPKCVGTSGVYYSTKDGTWYHSKSNCDGMKGATIVTLAMINARKQTACPTCIGGSSSGITYYWATANGDNYHSKSNCNGMRNATKITARDAEKRGQTACPECVGSVWGTKDGDNYHKTATCRGMKDAYRMTIQAAEKDGKTACPECIGGAAAQPTVKPDTEYDSTLYYYATDDGTWYHREQYCTGMRGAKKLSEKEAKATGKKPCPECIGSVYATEDGDHYHSKPNCTGMKNASLVTVDTAELRGQSPCPYCLDGDTGAPVPDGNTGGQTSADPANTIVYCTLTGRKYHSQQYCSGMQYAGAVTLAWALDPAYEPCTKCNPPKAGTVDEDDTMVYVTLGGESYHATKNCSGMRKAVDVPLSWALNPDFKRCTECDAPRP